MDSGATTRQPGGDREPYAAAASASHTVAARVILTCMTHRVGPKGQVVIPKDLRDEFGIEPGDEVVLWRDGDHVAVATLRGARPLKGRFADRSLINQLERDRAQDRQREESR